MNSILIIEDDNGTRRTMERILEFEGFRCRTASDGSIGLALIQEELPDLILCDIIMDGMDGYQVLERLHQKPETAAIPFVFVTALGDRDELRRGMTSGADDYLTKPFTDVELVATVVSRLNRGAKQGVMQSAGHFAKELNTLKQSVSQRELEVLSLVGKGMTSRQISDLLKISFKTAQAHRTNLMKKLNAVNAAHLARWAVIAEILQEIP